MLFFTSRTANDENFGVSLWRELAIDNVCNAKTGELHKLVESVIENLEELVVNSSSLFLSQKLHLYLSLYYLFLFFSFFVWKKRFFKLLNYRKTFNIRKEEKNSSSNQKVAGEKKKERKKEQTIKQRQRRRNELGHERKFINTAC